MVRVLYSSFAGAWEQAMRLHETIAENRLKLSAQLSQMGDELSALAKEVDKNRKHVRRLPSPDLSGLYSDLHQSGKGHPHRI